VPSHEPVTHVRLNIYPDGGVARLRLFGSLSERGAETLALRWVDSLAPTRAEEELLTVCGSRRWARDMMASRPFGSMLAMREAAARTWAGLGREDRLEAFAAHPRIGERSGARATAWSRDEQSASSRSAPDVVEALDQATRDYEQRFGHIFLISATGLGADDILASLQTRLDHDADSEFDVASAEQAKIIDLRLARLITP
jgi:OHCU decarboxylase